MDSFTDLHDDIRAYLNSLVPNLPFHTREEIAAYCVNRFIIREGDIINDVLKERDNEWKDVLRRKEKS